MVVKRPQNIFSGVLFSVLLFSCSGGRDNGAETEEPAKEADTTLVDTPDSIVEVAPIPEPEAFTGTPKGNFFVRSDSFIHHYGSAYDTSENRKVLLPERFSSAHVRKFSLIRKQGLAINDSVKKIPQARVWLFEYDDTTQLQLVRRNWFYEFGDNRTEIQVGENTVVKSQPLTVFIGETSIAVLETDCEAYREFSWKNVVKGFERLFSGSGTLRIRVDCAGNLRW